MDNLREIVRETVFSYAGGGINLHVYPFANEERQVYAVNIVDFPVRKRPAAVVVIARVEGDTVYIEEDLTDRPLVDALVQAGIPREKIILTYVGETVAEN